MLDKIRVNLEAGSYSCEDMPTHVDFSSSANSGGLAPSSGEVSRRSASLNISPKTTKPIRPSFKSRWKSFRSKSRKEEPGHRRESDEGNSNNRGRRNSPSFDFFFMESFSDAGGYQQQQDELSVKICKNTIRQTLLDGMRQLKGNDNILLDLEAGKIGPADMKLLESLTKAEKNHCMLWVSFLARPEYLDLFHGLGADLTYVLPGEGYTALHLSSFTGCVNCVKWLVERGCNPNSCVSARPTSMGGTVGKNAYKVAYTPLHYAVLGNSVATVQYLVQQGARVADTVLHSAVLANAPECIQYLAYSTGGRTLDTYDHYGLTPLHVAADRGLMQCLTVILEYEDDDPDVTARRIDLPSHRRAATPLLLAAEGGYTDCVSYLISKGASLNLANYKGQTALHMAAKTQSVECAEILLRAGCRANEKDADSRTPLHAAVCKAHHAFALVELLVRWGADVNATDKYGYSPLHIAALNELSQCVDLLVTSGANVGVRTKGGLSALTIINRKVPSSVLAIRRKLDESLSFTEAEASNREAKLKLDFRYILQNSTCGEIGFLQTLQKEGYREMLEHPLCIAFLHLKWEKVRRFYLLRLLLCTTFVLLLSAYVMTALAHECYNAAKGIPLPYEPLCKNSSFVGASLMERPYLMEASWYALVGCTVIEIVRKLYSTPGYSSLKQYFLSLSNMIEWFVIICVFAISFIYTGRTYAWQNHLGAFAVLSGWSILMILIGQLPLFGTYIAMFTKVQGEFAKLLLAYSCLLVGFTVSFCVMFPTAIAFSNPLIGFVKILAMMTGELDLNALLLEAYPTDVLNYGPVPSKGHLYLNVSAHFTFVLFLVFVTVILMNLLVGIAVHDIEGLHKTAGLSKLVRQTELIYFLELALFHGYLPNRIMKMLKLTMFFSPRSYRVVMHVRPLNPREKRLPREVMQDALQVARQRQKMMKRGNTCASDSPKQAHKDAEQGLYSYLSIPSPNPSYMCTPVDGGFNMYAQEMQMLTNEVRQLKTLVEQLLQMRGQTAQERNGIS